MKFNVPRARNTVTNEEVGLSTHERLQSAQIVNGMASSRVIHGMSQRNYEKASLRRSGSRRPLYAEGSSARQHKSLKSNDEWRENTFRFC